MKREDLFFFGINQYGPYKDRKDYQGIFFNLEIFKEENVMMGGDINLTTKFYKVWDKNVRETHWLIIFLHKIEEVGLCNIEHLNQSLLG